MAAVSLTQYNNLFAQNITLSNQFKDLIQEYRTKNSSINANINRMNSKVNAIVNNMGSSIFRPKEAFFEVTKVYSKNGLKVKADIKDKTQSDWVRVSTAGDALGFFTSRCLTIVHCSRLHSFNGGVFDKPAYSKSKCRTWMQFIVAPHNASSDQINCEIEKDKLAITTHGSTAAFGSRSFPTNAIHISGLSSYKTLFVRFKNKAVAGKGAAQEISTYGGNASFTIDRLSNYPEIRY